MGESEWENRGRGQEPGADVGDDRDVPEDPLLDAPSGGTPALSDAGTGIGGGDVGLGIGGGVSDAGLGGGEGDLGGGGGLGGDLADRDDEESGASERK